MISRRSRPAKEPLSRELIVKTAYELLKEHGIEGMSMRKVAKALDTGPASLYVYVNNVQELSAYVLDYGLGQMVYPDSKDSTWKEQLFDILHTYFLLLFEKPGLAEISLSTIPQGTNFLHLTEHLLAALHEGGIKSTSAAWGVDLLLLYVSSVAYEKVSWKKQGSSQITDTKKAFLQADKTQFPFIHRVKEEMFAGDTVSMKRFRWGIDVILYGIQQEDN
ncbi:TetR/AcrR family transcriptional regulator [Bacillus altitudinis MN12]|nr:TetR/AcrR family transcriptional regulator [Bacillus altitudinis]MDH8710517.1 AcrR family transcriptional regulator [Micromonospora sp. 1209]MBR0581477.1 TetR/AcrR family transcriptional regulator [Bacillus altitudinis MN12]MBR0595232.1 TetR/AcrR family transcriptional regulator [Bacillus altitudinis C16B11]MBR0608885.1 TetR/AcrR family transcriptional regulator [Bacillus altitudinis]WHX73495.1 TetR/AcrR family transcriptional regulator [Bacillus altitudinis]